MIKVNKSQITLENVRNSDYWGLISLIVWNHYSEKKHQEGYKISFEEEWYGKATNNSGSQHSENWKNPSYTVPNYIRTMSGITIRFEREDYSVRIKLSCESGCIHSSGRYNVKETGERGRLKLQTYNIMQISNWMLKHNFFIL